VNTNDASLPDRIVAAVSQLTTMGEFSVDPAAALTLDNILRREATNVKKKTKNNIVFLLLLFQFAPAKLPIYMAAIGFAMTGGELNCNLTNIRDCFDVIVKSYNSNPERFQWLRDTLEDRTKAQPPQMELTKFLMFKLFFFFFFVFFFCFFFFFCLT
jgi:hypothetical protein